MLLSGFLTHKLTGHFVDSVGSQVGYIPFYYKALSWSKKWDWKWQAVPMNPDLLPEIVPHARPPELVSLEIILADPDFCFTEWRRDEVNRFPEAQRIASVIEQDFR